MMAVMTAMFAFVACGGDNTNEGEKPTPGNKTQLAKPEVSVKATTETSITIEWNAVENADNYVVMVGNETNSTTECTYTLENLSAGEYTIRVKAQGEGYRDSVFASVSASVTGPTSVSWFTQTLIPVTEPTEVDGQNGKIVLQPWDAVFFNWTGTAIAELQYGFFATADLEGMSTSQIMNELEKGSDYLSYVNDEKGFTAYFNGLTGSTSYTLYTWVKNAEGEEFLASSEIKTAKAELTDATKAWLGSYTAQTAKMVNLNSGEITDKVTEFTFTVESIEGTADQVLVYGLSNLDSELPAIGYAVADKGVNYLCIMALEAVADIGNGWYATWYPYCQAGSRYTFVTGNFVAYAFTMDDKGAISYVAGGGQLQDESEFTVVAMDLLGYNGQKIGLIGTEEGDFQDWKYGDITNIAKAEAAPAVASKSAANLSVGKVLPASVVVAK